MRNELHLNPFSKKESEGGVIGVNKNKNKQFLKDKYIKKLTLLQDLFYLPFLFYFKYSK